MAEQWFYTCEGKQMDPVPAAELKQLAAGGLLKPEDLVWKEGMPKWVPASTIKGLFPPAGSGNTAGTPAPSKGGAKKTEEAVPLRRREKTEEEADQPRRRSRRDDYEEDEYDEEEEQPRRRSRRDDYEENEYDEEEEQPRRKKKRKQGLAAGALIGIIGGGVVLLLVVGGLAFWLIGNFTPRAEGFIADYSVSLNPKTLNARNFNFRAGVNVEIVVTSDTNDDVDVLVKRGNQIVAGDESIGPNSLVVFMPPGGGDYKVEIRNLGMGRTRSHVKIRELQPGQAPAVKPAPPPMGRPF